MATPFLGSEEYDERAHRLYDDGEYDAALDTLKEGLRRYPESVELHVGLGYTRLAREEYVWAKHAFEHALRLDGEHEDAHAGLGETLLRFGESERAMAAFRTARDRCDGEPELMLSMGRALYRAHLYKEAVELFSDVRRRHPGHAEAAAALGYTLHRLEDEAGARHELRRALELDADLHEARVYLAHLLYDRGDWDGALRQYERVPLMEHWDALAIERTIELKRAIQGPETDSVAVERLAQRLAELDSTVDALDSLLAELGDPAPAIPEPSARPGPHSVRLSTGDTLTGTWLEIVRQIRDRNGDRGETVARFMRRWIEEQRSRGGVVSPVESPREFLRAGEAAGYWCIDY